MLQRCSLPVTHSVNNSPSLTELVCTRYTRAMHASDMHAVLCVNDSIMHSACAQVVPLEERKSAFSF